MIRKAWGGLPARFITRNKIYVICILDKGSLKRTVHGHMAGTSRTLEFMGFFLSLERSNAHEKELEDCRACARSSAAERVTGVCRPQERLHRCLRSGRRYHRRNCRPHNKGRKIRRVLFFSS